MELITRGNIEDARVWRSQSLQHLLWICVAVRQYRIGSHGHTRVPCISLYERIAVASVGLARCGGGACQWLVAM